MQNAQTAFRIIPCFSIDLVLPTFVFIDQLEPDITNVPAIAQPEKARLVMAPDMCLTQQATGLHAP